MNDLDILGEIPDNLPVLTKPEDGEVVYKNIFDDSKYVSALNFFSTRSVSIFFVFSLKHFQYFSLMVHDVVKIVLKNLSPSTPLTHCALSQDLRVETLRRLLKCRLF